MARMARQTSPNMLSTRPSFMYNVITSTDVTVLLQPLLYTNVYESAPARDYLEHQAVPAFIGLAKRVNLKETPETTYADDKHYAVIPSSANVSATMRLT